ncbi:MAG: tRNA dihydrouridine synthase DusB, partial [Ignavibacteriaceae bacterium]|nr:tRNA dihydrouridine synthase DusB [Ignavibacteriaceae bacterium]
LSTGQISTIVDEEMRIKTCLKHLKLAVKVKGERRGVLEHRKFYAGYQRGMYGAARIRSELMKLTEFNPVEDALMKYLGSLKQEVESV